LSYIEQTLQSSAGHGSIVETAAAVSQGAVHVLADVAHTGSTYTSGYSELLWLSASGWAHVTVSAEAPSSHFMLTTVAGGILAAGSACPGKGGCTVDLEALALLRPGADPDVIPLYTPPGVPAPVSIAAGADAVVVTNPRVAAAASAQPPTRKCLIYDLPTGTWYQGPTTLHSQAGLGTYWTPRGSSPSANSAPAASNQLASAVGSCDPPASPDVNRRA